MHAIYGKSLANIKLDRENWMQSFRGDKDTYSFCCYLVWDFKNYLEEGQKK